MSPATARGRMSVCAAGLLRALPILASTLFWAIPAEHVYLHGCRQYSASSTSWGVQAVQDAGGMVGVQAEKSWCRPTNHTDAILSSVSRTWLITH